jgi:hypothetical protein
MLANAPTVGKSAAMSIVEYLPTFCINLKAKTTKLTLGPRLPEGAAKAITRFLKENCK